MGVPSTRTPVRIARGTYANLTTVDALAALEDGEICFATDLGRLYVKQSGVLEAVSAATNADPAPGDVTASPAFASGTGTQADPYIITNGAVPFSGGTLNSSQEITLDATAGDIVVLIDNSGSGSGTRFANQDVGIVNSAGKFTFNLKYIDNPGTATNNTSYTGDLQIGSTYFSWVVVQSNLTQLSQATATTVAGTLGIDGVLTATEGTVSGGTSPYTYATRWQRSLNGTSGWFDINVTGTTYTQTANDAGYYLRAVTTATDSTSGAAGGPLTFELESASTSQIPITAAPVISAVALSEDNSGGSRFTSESFTVASTMVNDGTPISSKSLKATVTANFLQYPSTDSVSSNSSSTTNGAAFSYNQPGTNSQYYPYNITKWINETLGKVGYTAFVQSSSRNYFYTSIDGTNWTSAGDVQNTGSYYGATRWSNYKLVATRGASPIMTWSENNPTAAGVQLLNSVGFDLGADANYAYAYDNSNRRLVRWTHSNGVIDTSSISYTQINGGPGFYNSPGVATGNGITLIANILPSPYSCRIYRFTNSDFSSTATITSNVNFDSVFYNQNCKWLLFEGGYFWVNWNGNVYRSSDGVGWTLISPLNPNSSSWPPAEWVYENNAIYAVEYAASNSYRVVRSNNFGATWTVVSGNTSTHQSPASFVYGFGKYLIGGYTPGSAYASNLWVSNQFVSQTVTLNSTTGLSSFNVGDSIRLEGQTDGYYYGHITNISGTSVTIRSSYEFQFGDVIEGLASTGNASSSKYIVMNTQGNVSALTSTDPGFVSFGPGTSHSITFPATLSTGGAPDTELPSGTSLQVTVRATNSVGTDDYTSNSVTPT